LLGKYNTKNSTALPIKTPKTITRYIIAKVENTKTSKPLFFDITRYYSSSTFEITSAFKSLLKRFVTYKHISDFRKYKLNWNGNGAMPFSEKIIRKALAKLSLFENEIPRVFPTARSSIQFEFHTSSKHYLEFEIFIDKTTYLQFTPPNHFDKGECEANDKMMEIFDTFMEQIVQYGKFI
jgi:hypothetical protein